MTTGPVATSGVELSQEAALPSVTTPSAPATSETLAAAGGGFGHASRGVVELIKGIPRPHNGRRCVTLILIGVAPLGAQGSPTSAPSVAPQPEPPAWAMPLGASGPAPVDSVTLRRIAGSRMAYTEQRARDRFNVADWYPESHPVMPDVVARGRSPAVWACAYCHLPDGAGRPENSTLAGLPAKYILQQVAAFRSGARGTPWHAPNKPADFMRTMADSATPREVAAAARYFSKLRLNRRAHVVEAERIPRVRAGVGLYFPAAEGGDEALGQRLIEVASDAERHELRDARAEYVAYVPPGSIARGRELATRGIPGVAKSACMSCHGPRLRGVGLVPPIAGRSPSYLLRQLLGFAAGARATPEAAPMRAVAAALRLDDMIGAAAYAGSLAP